MSSQNNGKPNRISKKTQVKMFNKNNNAGSNKPKKTTNINKSKTNEQYRSQPSKTSVKEFLSSMNSITNYTTDNNPIIKLPNSKLASIIILAVIGAILFNLGVFMSNVLNKPITGAVYNSMPAGLIVGLFVKKDQLDRFLFGNLIARGINFFLIGPTFLLYYYKQIDAAQYIMLSMIMWAIATLIANHLQV
uniref:Uncharacterized protein n=1 Tax=viral metagenome TaxID=1070528 RepID=A0A6C0F4M8_9ZZZZ